MELEHIIIAVLATQVAGLGIAVYYALKSSNEYRLKFEELLMKYDDLRRIRNGD